MPRIIYCPVNGWNCPYYKEGKCILESPMNDCDDFGYFWEEDDEYWIESEEEK